LASVLVFGWTAAGSPSRVQAADGNEDGGSKERTSCPVTHQQLKAALEGAVAADQTGLRLDMWGVVVDRDGIVCAVAFSGKDRDDQWPESRQIAASKAFTANGLSLDNLAFSTAELFPLVQPGQFLYGLAFGNPLDPAAAYKGPASRYGTPNDPLIGRRAGGQITFGGGLPLYKGGKVVGGLGLSGDTSCADHSKAWRVRLALKLAPAGSGPLDDRIVLSNNPTQGHAHCPNDAGTQGAA
jgi:uncharacterized protein GlcG (DUF336 family)